jgi:hypothetical protein
MSLGVLPLGTYPGTLARGQEGPVPFRSGLVAWIVIDGDTWGERDALFAYHRSF